MKSQIEPSKILLVISLFLILSGVLNGTFVITEIYRNRNDAKIVNDTGLMRGGIQRIIKLEMAGIHDESKILELDILFDSISNEQNKIFLSKSENLFFDEIDYLHNKWHILNKAIYKYRLSLTDNDRRNLLVKSEELWDISNDVVFSAQQVYEKKLRHFGYVFVFILLNFLAILMIIWLNDRVVKNKLEVLANYDGLTKAYNKNIFNIILDKEKRYSERYQSPLSIIMYDIDYFKKVNDTYGHAKGDFVLSKISTIVRTHIRASDSFCRIGGEEFAIIIPEILDNAHILAEKLRREIEEVRFFNDLKITLSFGVTGFINGETIETFCKRADDALYRAKNKGRNIVEADYSIKEINNQQSGE